jgi:hypothetical protein
VGRAGHESTVESSRRLFQRSKASVYLHGLLGMIKDAFMCEGRAMYWSMGP